MKFLTSYKPLNLFRLNTKMEKKIVKDIGKRKFLRSSKSKLFIINEAKPAITCTYLI